MVSPVTNLLLDKIKLKQEEARRQRLGLFEYGDAASDSDSY